MMLNGVSQNVPPSIHTHCSSQCRQEQRQIDHQFLPLRKLTFKRLNPIGCTMYIITLLTLSSYHKIKTSLLVQYINEKPVIHCNLLVTMETLTFFGQRPRTKSLYGVYSFSYYGQKDFIQFPARVSLASVHADNWDDKDKFVNIAKTFKIVFKVCMAVKRNLWQ